MKFFTAFVPAFSLLVTATAVPSLRASSVSVYSSGFVVPETISLAPSSYGLPAGTLLVADAGNQASPGSTSTVYTVPPAGGTPTPIGGSFSAGAGGTYGGIFASSSFGSLSGSYVAFGWSSASNAGIYSLSSPGGSLTPIYTDPNTSFSFEAPVQAPTHFGSVGGYILAAETLYSGTTAPIVALSPSGTVSTFASITNFKYADGNIGAFGTAFTPAGFVPGTTGSELLVADSRSGAIDWIDSSGDVHLFTTVPLEPNQTGLRAISFAPVGFGVYGGDLFVSVSGSVGGGGDDGSVDVINSAGDVVGIIEQGTVDQPFDPRGLLFDNGDLLIANSDPSIFSATPAAVTAVPEPRTLSLLLASSLIGLAAATCRRFKAGMSPLR